MKLAELANVVKGNFGRKYVLYVDVSGSRRYYKTDKEFVFKLSEATRFDDIHSAEAKVKALKITNLKVLPVPE